MMSAARLHLSFEADLGSFRRGSDALMQFAEDHPDSLDHLAGLVNAGQAFVAVQRREDDLRLVVVASRPSRAMLRVVRAWGGQRAVNAMLHAFGFDPDLRAAA